MFCFARLIGDNVPEVKDAGGPAPVLEAGAGHAEPCRQIAILMAPADEIGVKAVDFQKILSPGSHIAASYFLHAPLDEPAAPGATGKTRQRRQPIDRATAQLAKPLAKRPILDHQIFL